MQLEVRRLLVVMTNGSILVVEDIDCSKELQDRLAETRALHPLLFRQQLKITRLVILTK